MVKSGKKKQTKAFLKKGMLESQVKARHKARDLKQKIQSRKAKRSSHRAELHREENEARDTDSEDQLSAAESSSDESDVDVEALLNAEGIASDEDEDEEASGSEDGGELEDDDLEGLEAGDDDEGLSTEKHMEQLQALAKSDPEFYKYLKENDSGLLDFEEGDEEDVEEGSKKKKNAGPVIVTNELIKTWQKSMLQNKSVKALRKLLIVFRVAANSSNPDEADAPQEYAIKSSKVFNKVLKTTFTFTPMVLSSYAPYKEVNGRYKISGGAKQHTVTQRVLKSYFVSLESLIDSVSKDSGIAKLAIDESSKLTPWIIANMNTARGWVRLLLRLYDGVTSNDETKLAALLALRRLVSAGDRALKEHVLKNVYTTLLLSFRRTSVYTLPSVRLMKNAASELYLVQGKQDTELVYQVVYTYIRMLALLLRKAVKQRSKDAFKAVYNWQFVHAIDFWSLVLSNAAQEGDTILRHLIFPLVEVALGAIRLVPTAKYFPLRFHLVSSLLRLQERTQTYIPLATPLFEVLESPSIIKPAKKASLKPLDLTYYLKCPTAYEKTRVYAETVSDEAAYFLIEYYASLSNNIAFPDLVVPAIAQLRKLSKKMYSTSPKVSKNLKVLIEKLEGNAAYIDKLREDIDFAPRQRDKVDHFAEQHELSKTPLSHYLKITKRVRQQKLDTLERAALGEDEE